MTNTPNQKAGKMPEIYEVADVEEAVELAHKLKEEGRYDWFRGQTQGWPPISSLNRLYKRGDPEALNVFYRRMEMLDDWLKEIPELQYLREADNVHSLFAIMQHYGIQTHYIDFSTDPGVAGFFAADTKTPPIDEKSCIYCLDTKDLMSVWDAIKDLEHRKGARIELIQIDVRNLWRLQSQCGVFLSANYNWQVDYPMDSIIFPYSDYPSYPTHGEIYPKDKSPLEQLLDQYFSLEQTAFATGRMRKIIQETQGAREFFLRPTVFPGGFLSEAFVAPSSIAPVGSWNPEALKAWKIAPKEDYQEAMGPTIPLKIKTGAKVEVVRRSVSFGVMQALRSNPSIRSKAIRWSFAGLPQSLPQEKVEETLRPVWNGMRRLPYADREIADAFASLIALLVIELEKPPSAEDTLSVFSECFGDCIDVGFTNSDESVSRGVASRESLRKALRKDMTTLLTPEFKTYTDDVRDVFRIIYNPTLMFEWDEFKSMFAREVIPAQAIKQRNPILFNPAELITFGIP